MHQMTMSGTFHYFALTELGCPNDLTTNNTTNSNNSNRHSRSDRDIVWTSDRSTGPQVMHNRNLDMFESNDLSVSPSVIVHRNISIDRPILYAQDYFPILKTSSYSIDEPTAPTTGLVSQSSFTRFRSYCKRQICPDQQHFRVNTRSLWHFLQSIFPILHWLPRYDVRDNLLADFVTGITILALHIPQGLAYGRLAGVEPIYGLYVSLFPVIIYSLMGTSRQISMGTFAVVSILCRDTLNYFKIPIDEASTSAALPNNATAYLDTELLQFGDQKLRPIEVLTSMALLIGLIQVL